mgnify:CR=1 FL=1
MHQAKVYVQESRAYLNNPQVPLKRRLTNDQEGLVTDLNSLISKMTQGKFFWSSLQINLNTNAIEHFDEK